MAEGLQIWDDTGALVLDYTTYVGRFLGSFNTGGAETGSITDAGVIGQNFFSFPLATDGKYGGPQVTANSSTGVISWDYSVVTAGSYSVDSSDREHTIFYGAY